MLPSLATLLQLLSVYGYILLFFAGFFEGPIVTILAGLLVALRVFNPALAFVTIALADTAGDTAYYLLGRLGGTRAALKYGSWLGITEEKLKNAQASFGAHRTRAVAGFKFIHGIGFVGFIAAGVLRVPYRSIILQMIFFTLLQTTFFLCIGYMFGAAYVQLSQYLDYFAIIVSAIVAILIGAYLIHKRMSK